MASRTLATVFVLGVGLAAVLCASFAATTASWPSSENLPMAVVFAILMAVATVRPVHLGFRLNIDLTTVLIIAMALSLPAGLAIIMSLAGAVGGQLLQRTTWSGIVFNSGQIVLQVATAAGILAGFGWKPEEPAFSEVRYVPVMVLAMVSVFLVNTVLVATIIGLQSRIQPLLVWRDALTPDLLIEQTSQFALGLVTAIVVSVQVWILPLLAAPGIILYVSASRKSSLQFQTQDAISALADLVDQRDPYTADHSRRVAIVARELATRLDLAPDEIESIERAARVHDLGKLVIDLSVLNKNEPLTADEWNLFRRHPADGANILTWFPEFRASTSFVRHHHERWDGRGYPNGLAGNEIPLGARILAVADALDAMSSARPYRNPLTAEMIRAEFIEHRAVQWDALVVDALFELIDSGAIDLATREDTTRVYEGLGTVVQNG
ncbi:hypothetical protein BH23CHL2_BH23CHL2_23280 [soil metagenome]